MPCQHTEEDIANVDTRWCIPGVSCHTCRTIRIQRDVVGQKPMIPAVNEIAVVEVAAPKPPRTCAQKTMPYIVPGVTRTIHCKDCGQYHYASDMEEC